MVTRPFIGVIADDLTGATDIALTLSRGGMRVRQVAGIPADEAVLYGTDAVVIALKSRTIPAAEAVDLSLRAARELLGAGCRQLVFKYCSTFDSTDEGNIGPVTEALLALLGESRTLACPAFPANGRTVYKGHLFVGDALLSDSSMKDHPLTPMRDANLVRVLARQTALPVSLIDIATVRGPALRERLMATEGIAIVDALDENDLRAIGAAAGDFRLITGGSGIALGLPALLPLAGRHGTAETSPLPDGRSVVLAGSCSAATRRQVARALAAGFPGLSLDPVAIAEGRQVPQDALDFALTCPASAVPVIYASAAPEAVAESQRRLGRMRAGAVVEDFLARLAAGLADNGFDRIVVAGGETSGAVTAGLGLENLDIGPEIDPGVPWMLAKRGGKPLAVALKSGNFGADDMFLKAWEKLQ